MGVAARPRAVRAFPRVSLTKGFEKRKPLTHELKTSTRATDANGFG